MKESPSPRGARALHARAATRPETRSGDKHGSGQRRRLDPMSEYAELRARIEGREVIVLDRAIGTRLPRSGRYPRGDIKAAFEEVREVVEREGVLGVDVQVDQAVAAQPLPSASGTHSHCSTKHSRATTRRTGRSNDAARAGSGRCRTYRSFALSRPRPADRVGITHTLELTVSWTELEAPVVRGADAENVQPYYATRDLPEETPWRRPKVQRTDRDDTALPEAIADYSSSFATVEPEGRKDSRSEPSTLIQLLSSFHQLK